MAARKIAVISGSRAEYGLLYWLLDRLRNDMDIELQLILTGMHVLPQFGNTAETVKADGFMPAAIVPMDLRDDTATGMAHAMASVLAGMTDVLAKLQPDLVVLLGDRFEIMASAQAALCLKIPVAHIHGGELTEGNIDESIRHAITKMAHVHFVAADEFKNRVIQLGENPANVHMVGAVGLENLFAQPLPDKLSLQAALNLTFRDPVFMVTYHPVTLDNTDPVEKARALCMALDEFPDTTIILTGANADAGGQRMTQVYKDYAAKHEGRMIFRDSLGHRNYLAALGHASVVIGNSSSGLIEAPSAGLPTVNIGDRQKGRLSPPSMIQADDTAESIAAAIRTALTPESRALAAKKQNPYFAGPHPSQAIAATLKSVKLDGLIRKPFFDLG